MMVRLRTWGVKTFQPLYERLNHLTGGMIAIPVDASRRFGRARASESAASLAFYAVFSLFPLLGLLVALASSILPREQIFSLLYAVLSKIFPTSGELISENINRFIASRGAISLVAGIGLLWSASNVFTILVYHISTAWEKAHLRSYIHNRLIAIAIIAVIIFLIAILYIVTALLHLLDTLFIPVIGNLNTFRTFPGNLLSVVTPAVLGFVIFFLLYRYVPATRVRTAEAAISAAVVLAVWEGTAALFIWFTGNQGSSYNQLYGPVSALALLMLWFYFNSLILLFGAHICAGIARFRGVREGQLTPVTHGEEVAKAERGKTPNL